MLSNSTPLKSTQDKSIIENSLLKPQDTEIASYTNLNTRACDQCRQRKIRCNFDKPQCNSCDRRNKICTYNDLPKKRGPKPKQIQVPKKEGTGLGLSLDPDENSLPMSIPINISLADNEEQSNINQNIDNFMLFSPDQLSPVFGFDFPRYSNSNNSSLNHSWGFWSHNNSFTNSISNTNSPMLVPSDFNYSGVNSNNSNNGDINVDHGNPIVIKGFNAQPIDVVETIQGIETLNLNNVTNNNRNNTGVKDNNSNLDTLNYLNNDNNGNNLNILNTINNIGNSNNDIDILNHLNSNSNDGINMNFLNNMNDHNINVNLLNMSQFNISSVLNNNNLLPPFDMTNDISSLNPNLIPNFNITDNTCQLNGNFDFSLIDPTTTSSTSTLDYNPVPISHLTELETYLLYLYYANIHPTLPIIPFETIQFQLDQLESNLTLKFLIYSMCASGATSILDELTRLDKTNTFCNLALGLLPIVKDDNNPLYRLGAQLLKIYFDVNQI